MFDQIPSRTIPIQWAMVLAASITTCGVIVAACIQSGWIEKPYSASFTARQSSPVSSQAAEAKAIDPPNELGFDISQPAAANTPAYLTGATQGSIQPTELQPISSPADRQIWIISEPEFMPAAITAESICSPK
jgi:hypothetical protein